MKKLFGVMFLATFALVLTGCGNDVLTCTKGDETIQITFDGDKIVKMSNTETMESEEEAKQLVELYNKYSEDKDTKVTSKGKKVTMTVTGAALEEQLDGERATKAETKKEAEEDGYKCK